MGSRKKGRLAGSIVLVLLLFVITGLWVASLPIPTSAESLGSWNPTTSYPTNIEFHSCATSSGYIYCVGGYTIASSATSATNAVYYAAVSSSGVGAWTSTASYPTNIRYESCAISSGYIYCVAGYASAETVTKAVYYSPATSSGVGAWTSTASYPIGVLFHSCAISSGYIYCAGGSTGGETVINAAYYAAVSSGSSSSSSTSRSSSSSSTSSSHSSSSTTSSRSSSSTTTTASPGVGSWTYVGTAAAVVVVIIVVAAYYTVIRGRSKPSGPP